MTFNGRRVVLRRLASALLLLAAAGSLSLAGEKPAKRRQVAGFIGTARAQATKLPSRTVSPGWKPTRIPADPGAAHSSSS